jgi:hypothetical protein
MIMRNAMKSLGNDPIFILLLGATFIFAMMLIFVEYKFGNDGQMFQVMSNLTSSFAGAVLLRAKPISASTKEDDKGNDSTISTSIPVSTVSTVVPSPTVHTTIKP